MFLRQKTKSDIKSYMPFILRFNKWLNFLELTRISYYQRYSDYRLATYPAPIMCILSLSVCELLSVCLSVYTLTIHLNPCASAHSSLSNNPVILSCSSSSRLDSSLSWQCYSNNSREHYAMTHHKSMGCVLTLACATVCLSEQTSAEWGAKF